MTCATARIHESLMPMALCEPGDLFAPQIFSRPPPFVDMQVCSSSINAKRKFSQISVDTEDIQDDAEEEDFQPSQKRQRTQLQHERPVLEEQRESPIPSLTSDATTPSPSAAAAAPVIQNKCRPAVEARARPEYERDFYVDCTEEHPKHGANYVNHYYRPRGMSKSVWLAAHPILHQEIAVSEMYDAVRNLAWLKSNLVSKEEREVRCAEGTGVSGDDFMWLGPRQVRLLFGREDLKAADLTMESGAFVTACRMVEWVDRIHDLLAASYSNWMALGVAAPDDSDSDLDLKVEVTAMRDLRLLIDQTRKIAEDLAVSANGLDFDREQQEAMYLYVGDESSADSNQVLEILESTKRSLQNAANHLAQLEYHAQTNLSGIFDNATRNYCLLHLAPLANAVRGIIFTIRHGGLMHFRCK